MTFPSEHAAALTPGQIPSELLQTGRQAFAEFALTVLALTPSTQDAARRAARAGAAEGLCVVAHEQTAGRGRGGRAWVAPPATALLLSVVLDHSAARVAGLPIAAGLAVVDAVRALGTDVGLKWPNDVVTPAGRKLAGILAEVEPQRTPTPAIVLGVGINLTVAEFPAGIAGISLHELVSAPLDWCGALTALLPHLRRRLDILDSGGVVALRADWTARAVGLGGPITAQSGGVVVRGTALGIDDDGALLVKSDGNITRLIAGDVHIGPPPADLPPSALP